MLERDIEKYLVKRVKEIGGKAYKFVSPGNAGVPDRIVVLPKRLVFFVELKAPGGKLTALQTNQIDKLLELDQIAVVLNSINAVDCFIEWAKESIRQKAGDAE